MGLLWEMLLKIEIYWIALFIYVSIFSPTYPIIFYHDLFYLPSDKIQELIGRVTLDNNHDGIYHALSQLEMIEKDY